MDNAIYTVFYCLYCVIQCGVQHPLLVALAGLAVGYIRIAEVDVRGMLAKLYLKFSNFASTKRECVSYAYNMTNGPHTWKCDMNCQSPINIDDTVVQKLVIRELLNWNHYDDLPSSVSLENTGNTLIVRASYQGNRPTISGADLLACYTLVEMRFHWGWSNSEGSEHTLNNKKLPLELQVMHRTGPFDGCCTSSYDILMIAYFFELSAHNPYLDPITQNLKLVQKAGKKATIAPFPLSYVIYPFRTGFYSYGGSLTEPPCYQGTEWFVFPESMAINEFQLRQFRQLLSADGKSPITRNSRPVQNLGSRVVSLNQFCLFENCQVLVMQENEDDCCEEETTINTTTIITTTNITKTGNCEHELNANNTCNTSEKDIEDDNCSNTQTEE